MTHVCAHVLGPVSLLHGDSEIDIGFPKQRFLLASLLADAGRPVRTESLIERLWGEDPPKTARNALYTYVAQTRAALSPLGVSLVRQGGGYLLRVPPEAVDLHRFRSLIAEARDCPSDHRVLALLTEALALFTGTPFDGLDSPWADAVRVTLASERRWSVLRRSEILLRLGRHAEALAELRQATVAAPLDELLAAQLMLALNRSGQRAAALRHYHAVRTVLVRELGVEPSPPLQGTYQSLLNDDEPPPGAHQRPGGVPSAVVPAQLLHDLPYFVGRTRELALLERAALAPQGHRAGTGETSPICTIQGPPGVGKSALAVHLGHRLAARFPDGQLYVDLGGFGTSGRSLSPEEVLGRFLRAMGARHADGDLDELAAQYRSATAGRRMLVLLDNARSSAQVRPLLPGHPGCLVVITCRRRLTGLTVRDQAVPVPLGPLSTAESLQLLDRLLGTGWSASDPRAAEEICRRCANLPLALVTVAGQVAGQSRTTPSDLLHSLKDHARLDGFERGDGEDGSLRAVFASSFEALSPPAAQVFRLFGLHCGPWLTAPAVGALTGGRADDALRELVFAHLVETPRPGRYAVSGLLHAYAGELAAADPPEGQSESLRRMAAWYVHTAARAAAALQPSLLRVPLPPLPRGCPPPLEFGSFQDALDWCRSERANVVGLFRPLPPNGRPAAPWQLTALLMYYLFIDRPIDDWTTLCRTGLDIAERDGDALGRAWMLTGLGVACQAAGRSHQAVGHLRDGLRLWQQVAAPRETAMCQVALASAHQELHDYATAARFLAPARDYALRADDGWTLSFVHKVQGHLQERQGSTTEALGHFSNSLAVHRRLRYDHGESWALHDLGAAYGIAGRFDEALAHLYRALSLRASIGDRRGVALTLRRMGEVHARSGRVAEAKSSWEEALTIMEGYGDARAVEIRERLAALAPDRSGAGRVTSVAPPAGRCR
ncbi:BTAD domain-containing putative transcriptional regulator [Streptomyces sp. NPDC046939]|uniref:AfsR/SARP family transcriptional regulator n=1 Tax=Streptomyces sp. NPDC046939 TaxID=3155376 RepID=UPI0033E2185C